jgi:hypothetical protein
VAEKKEVEAKSVYISTYEGESIRVITQATYYEDNGVVRGSEPGKSATLDLFVQMPDQSAFYTVDSSDLRVEEKVVIGPLGKPLVSKTYYYRVGTFEEDGKFQQTAYTGEVEGLQENFDRYNTNDPRKQQDGTPIDNEILNITRAANKAIIAQEGLPDVDPKRNQTLLNQRNLNPNQQALDDAVSAPAPINLTIESAPIRRDYGEYVYPLKMRENSQDRMKFKMRVAEGADITTSLENQSIRRRRTDKGIINGSVTLPIQSGIVDRNAVDWNPGSLNSVSSLAVGSSLKLMDSANFKDLGSNVEAIFKQVYTDLRKDASYADAFKLFLAQEAVGVQGLLSRATGAVLNPNLELLFNAPTLRPFTFTFKMSPRSVPEAAQVKQIIRFFKQGMSVKKAKSNVFLKAPNIFEVEYQTFDNAGTLIKHPSLNRIKECALTACDVEYTPDGTYMTFNDTQKTMTSYQMTLSFTELDPIYEDDYDDVDTTEIGF